MIKLAIYFQLNQFNICRKIIVTLPWDYQGRGSYGVVFEVADTEPESSTAPNHYAMKVQEGGEEFRKELKIMGQMNSENIVQLKSG